MVEGDTDFHCCNNYFDPAAGNEAAQQEHICSLGSAYHLIAKCLEINFEYPKKSRIISLLNMLRFYAAANGEIKSG